MLSLRKLLFTGKSGLQFSNLFCCFSKSFKSVKFNPKSQAIVSFTTVVHTTLDQIVPFRRQFCAPYRTMQILRAFCFETIREDCFAMTSNEIVTRWSLGLFFFSPSYPFADIRTSSRYTSDAFRHVEISQL